MENSIDRAVETILQGIDLEKHVELFQKHNINLELFSYLEAEDLKSIGIEDKSELELLLKYIKRTRKVDKWPNLSPLEYEELSKILENTEKYTHLLNVACDYVRKNIQNEKPNDELVFDDTSASSLIMKLCDKIDEENDALIKELNDIVEELKEDKTVHKSSKKNTVMKYTISTIFISIIIASFSFYRRNFSS